MTKQSIVGKNWIASLTLAMTILATPVLACEEHHQAMNELEAQIAANGAPHTPVALQAAPFPAQFATDADFKTWAETSTFGGGRYDLVNFAGHKLALAYRGYTSGVKSADISVYAQKDGAWHLVKSRPPIHNAWITAGQDGNTIVFRRDDNSETVMTLSAAEIGG